MLEGGVTSKSLSELSDSWCHFWPLGWGGVIVIKSLVISYSRASWVKLSEGGIFPIVEGWFSTRGLACWECWLSYKGEWVPLYSLECFQPLGKYMRGAWRKDKNSKDGLWIDKTYNRTLCSHSWEATRGRNLSSWELYFLVAPDLDPSPYKFE